MGKKLTEKVDKMSTSNSVKEYDSVRQNVILRKSAKYILETNLPKCINARKKIMDKSLNQEWVIYFLYNVLSHT